MEPHEFGKLFSRSCKVSGVYLDLPEELVPLGIPTVGDRIAQMSVVLLIEDRLEAIFHTDSYGYRPNRSAHDAIGKARERCWHYNCGYKQVL